MALSPTTIPEIVQQDPNTIINWRTTLLSQITDLGPPDLLQLIKNEGKTQLSTYLYYTGANTNDVASIAALLFEIASALGDSSQLWFGKQRQFKVSNAIFITYNAFSHCDIHVSIDIPGGVQWKIVDSHGNSVNNKEIESEARSADASGEATNDETNLIWLETYVSGIVRALITCDDEGEFAPIVEVKRVNPFTDTQSIELFLKGFEQLFHKGETLGCNEQYQVASLTHNYLIDALLKCVEITNCSDLVLPILSRLLEKYPELSFLIAKVMLLGDHEQQAVQFMKSKLENNSNDANLLFIQSQYCFDKGAIEMSLPLAIKAVNLSPTLFPYWAHLVRVYIALNKFNEALLTLNACPMVTHKDKFTLKRITISSQPNGPPSNDIHLPLPLDISLEGVSNLDHSKIIQEQSQCPPDLLHLPAANLKSTYYIAYKLLADLIKKLDWDQLLDYRAQVFVMEDELKNYKNQNGEKVGLNTVKSKRLCERWLDNLFMLLYEDLKIFTLFKQNTQYQDVINGTNNGGNNSSHLGQWSYSQTHDKCALEWELLGLLSNRLGHLRDAQRCFESALAIRFSVRSARGLVDIYSNYRLRAKRSLTKGLNKNINGNGNGNGNVLGQHLGNGSMISQLRGGGASGSIKDSTKFNPALLRLTTGLLTWEYKWYKTFSPKLLDSLEALGMDMGYDKLKNAVDSVQGANDKGLVELVESNLKCLVLWGRLDKE